MSANVPGEAEHRADSVRCVEDEDGGVTIHVSGSRHALLGAAMLGGVLVTVIIVAVTMFVTWATEVAEMPHLSAVALIGIVSIVGIAVVPAIAAVPMVRRLVRTGVRDVTFAVDAEQLHLLESGYGSPRRLTRGREVVLDVIVRRGAGRWLHELQIILGGEAPVSLLSGAREAELESLCRTLRRALNIDVRRRSVAGWWQDETDANDGAGAGANHPSPVLHYATQASVNTVGDRSSDRARVVIPPQTRQLLPQLAAPATALFIGLSAIAWVLWYQPSDASSSKLVWVLYAYPVIIAATMARPLLDCFRHRTIEINASEVTLATRTVFAGVGGRSIKRWPAGTVRDVVAEDKSLVLRLRSGAAETLIRCPSATQAAALAEALHPPPPPPPALDVAEADQTPPEPPHLSANST